MTGRGWMLGAAALGLAGGAYRVVMGGYRGSADACRVLTTKEQEIVAACADAFFPPGGPMPLSGVEAGLVAYMDAYVGRLPRVPRVLTRLLFHSIEHGPWAFGPRRKRFTKMSLEERLAVLESMRTSPIYFRRISFLSARTMLSMGYMAHPAVTRAMGIPNNPDPFGLGAQEAA